MAAGSDSASRPKSLWSCRGPDIRDCTGWGKDVRDFIPDDPGLRGVQPEDSIRRHSHSQRRDRSPSRTRRQRRCRSRSCRRRQKRSPSPSPCPVEQEPTPSPCTIYPSELLPPAPPSSSPTHESRLPVPSPSPTPSRPKELLPPGPIIGVSLSSSSGTSFANVQKKGIDRRRCQRRQQKRNTKGHASEVELPESARNLVWSEALTDFYDDEHRKCCDPDDDHHKFRWVRQKDLLKWHWKPKSTLWLCGWK